MHYRIQDLVCPPAANPTGKTMTKSMLFCTVLTGAVMASALLIHAARADVVDKLIGACHAQLQLSDTVCECIGQKAGSDLTDIQQRYVLAQLEGDQTTSDKLESEMTDDDVFVAGDWMDNAPAVCEYE